MVTCRRYRGDKNHILQSRCISIRFPLVLVFVLILTLDFDLVPIFVFVVPSSPSSSHLRPRPLYLFPDIHVLSHLFLPVTVRHHHPVIRRPGLRLRLRSCRCSCCCPYRLSLVDMFVLSTLLSLGASRPDPLLSPCLSSPTVVSIAILFASSFAALLSAQVQSF